MKIRFELPPKGEKDAFSNDVSRAEWMFKVFGWLIIIETLKYAAITTGHTSFTFWAFGLTFEIGYLVFSFVHHRVKFEIISPNGKKPYLRTIINIGAAAIVGWLSWQATNWIINDITKEIVELNKHSH